MPGRRHAPQQGLVVFAKNKKRVSAFYRQALALAVEESEASHDLLRGHGHEVVVHTIVEPRAASRPCSAPRT